MDDAKARFLFGEVPDGTDLHDPEVRDRLLDAGSGPVARARSALRMAVADDIVDEDPPEVWATAQRLLALEREPADVMHELVIARARAAQQALADGGRKFDPDDYVAALRGLPLPTVDEIEAAFVAAVRSRQPAGWDEADGLTLQRLGRPDDDAVARLLLDRVADRLLDDDGPLALLAGDRIVHVGDLTDGIVLAHRVTRAERGLDTLDVDFDLAGFARRTHLRTAEGAEVDVFARGRGALAWRGPEGWLAGYAEDALVAVRVDGEGVVTLEPLGPEPPADPGLVALVRAVYDAEVAEPGLPVGAEDLVLGVLIVDREAFGRPRPPLGNLCAAAGLERVGHEVAHDEEVWDNQRRLWRTHRVFDALGDQEGRRAACRVLEVSDDPDPSPEELRRALSDLGDPAVAEVAVDELVPSGSGARFAGALVGAATTPRQRALAHWVTAVVAERDGDVLGAEAHLRLAVAADPSSAVVVERCAWYASDRGDARQALHLWHQLTDPSRADLLTVAPFARRQGPKLGRNDACWCGSGRKYKTCHPGQEPPVALPERVCWLWRKATAYLEHAGAEASALVMTLAGARAVDDSDEALLAAFQDPIVLDAALTEGGWFDRFLEARGPLLPDDEALLAQAWTLVPRTVYEVVDVEPGVGLRVGDLSSGGRLDVRTAFSDQARAGGFVCARAVPDGEDHQFVGGSFPVAPGTEASVLDLCDEADPEAICEYAGRLHRPPVPANGDGAREG